ncbi:hypothetical protein BJV77DRAFT_1070535 [Russula vinacea]|nr:hypothetical protein BJV77DRAFT_1070535 [Russula vinacea]
MRSALGHPTTKNSIPSPPKNNSPRSSPSRLGRTDSPAFTIAKPPIAPNVESTSKRLPMSSNAVPASNTPGPYTSDQ